MAALSEYPGCAAYVSINECKYPTTLCQHSLPKYPGFLEIFIRKTGSRWVLTQPSRCSATGRGAFAHLIDQRIASKVSGLRSISLGACCSPKRRHCMTFSLREMQGRPIPSNPARGDGGVSDLASLSLDIIHGNSGKTAPGGNGIQGHKAHQG
jgi:hypothetical protein